MTDCRIDPTIWDDCTGPNKHCRKAARQGRTVHIIPPIVDARTTPIVVLPTHHYATRDEALAALEDANRNAVDIHTDADLYAAREAGVAYRLFPGWIDPSCR